jgi:hypothetical protein
MGMTFALAGAFLATSATTAVARADDDTCIAASENEIPLRKQGRLQEALTQLSICAARTCPEQITAECGRRIREINGVMPTIVLGATDSSNGDLAVVTVYVDGQPFATVLDGRPLTLDPGQHALHFVAAGMAPIDKMVVIREGEKDRRVTVAFQSPSSSSTYVPPTNNESIQAHKLYAEVSFGAAGIGIVVAAIAGIYALDYSAVPTSVDGTSTGVGGTATVATDIAIGGLVLAAAGGITGAVLWFTTPKPIRPGAPAVTALALIPKVGRDGDGLMLVGSF